MRQAFGCGAKLVVKADESSSIIQLSAPGPHLHNHSLDHMDRTMVSEGLKSCLVMLLRQGLAPAAVEQLVKGRRGEQRQRERLKEAGGEFLRTQTIRNIRNKEGIKTASLPRTLSGNEAEEMQIRELLDLFYEPKHAGEWRSQYVCEPGKVPVRSIVFARHTSIQALKEDGILCLMDSTYNTNKLGWYLYTVMCRDKFGVTVPHAFFLGKHLDAKTAAESLRVIIDWCGGLDGWRLEYMVTDDSAAEQKAVQEAFTVPVLGTCKVQHLLCVALPPNASQTYSRQGGS